MTPLLPPAASSHAAAIDGTLAHVHLLMLVLFAGWAVYFLWVLVRYRRGRQPVARHTSAGGRVAAVLFAGVALAEAVVLVTSALPLWYARTSARPADTNAVVIRVVAEQFAWNVQYPGADGQFGDTSITLVSPSNPIGLDRASRFGKDDLVLQNQMHLPINRPVIVQLSSKDVIHSFGVPAMRVKQDVIPGVLSTAWFTPILAGQFDIACSQLCGLGHYRMRGTITVESEDAFRQFLAQEAAAQVAK
jgi:cytochrome c oxidase subunit 2